MLEELENIDILIDYSSFLDKQLKEAISKDDLVNLCVNLYELHTNAINSKLDKKATLIIDNKKQMVLSVLLMYSMAKLPKIDLENLNILLNNNSNYQQIKVIKTDLLNKYDAIK